MNRQSASRVSNERRTSAASGRHSERQACKRSDRREASKLAGKLKRKGRRVEEPEARTVTKRRDRCRHEASWVGPDGLRSMINVPAVHAAYVRYQLRACPQSECGYNMRQHGIV